MDVKKIAMNPLSVKNNDSHSKKWVIVIFYTMEYQNNGKSNYENDSHLWLDASVILEIVNFQSFVVNAKR